MRLHSCCFIMSIASDGRPIPVRDRDSDMRLFEDRKKAERYIENDRYLELDNCRIFDWFEPITGGIY